MKDKSASILEAALGVFTETGYHDARIEDIAERAGVAKGTVYLYFAGKKELFQALMDEITGGHLATVETALNGSGTLKDKLTLIAAENLKLIVSRRDFARLNIHEMPLSDPSIKKKVLTFRDQYNRLIAAALAESATDASLPPDYWRDAAIAFTGILHAFEMEVIMGGRDIDLATLPQRIVNLFLEGLPHPA